MALTSSSAWRLAVTLSAGVLPAGTRHTSRMFCPECGSVISYESAKFCAVCGASRRPGAPRSAPSVSTYVPPPVSVQTAPVQVVRVSRRWGRALAALLFWWLVFGTAAAFAAAVVAPQAEIYAPAVCFVIGLVMAAFSLRRRPVRTAARRQATPAATTTSTPKAFPTRPSGVAVDASRVCPRCGKQVWAARLKKHVRDCRA